MNEGPIDFSLLDPMHDKARWQARIGHIIDATMRARRERESLHSYLVRYSRPALAVAAAIALVSWVSAMQSRVSAVTTADHPANTLLEWAVNDEVPPTSEVLQYLGVQDD